MENFRTRLKRGDLLLGTVVSFPVPEVGEILAEVGFDWLFIDLEHGPLELRNVLGLLQAVGEKTAGVVRVPLNDEVWIKRVLDLAPAGILVPQVNSVAEAERVIRYSKYPPLGRRSVGVGRAHSYGARFEEYVRSADQETAVIIQAEHMEAVQHIEAILQVPGIDAILIGPYDLSASLGKTGQLTDPEVQAAIQRVKQACQAARMPLGIFAGNATAARDWIEQGFSLLAIGMDAMFLSAAAGEALKTVRR